MEGLQNNETAVDSKFIEDIDMAVEFLTNNASKFDATEKDPIFASALKSITEYPERIKVLDLALDSCNESFRSFAFAGQDAKLKFNGFMSKWDSSTKEEREKMAKEVAVAVQI